MGVCQRCLRLFCRPRERRPAFTGRQITAFLPRSLCSCGRVTSQPFTWVLDKVYMNWINRHSPIDEGVAVGSCPINLVFLTQFGTCILCVPFNILERLIYARVETIIDPLLPREQVNFPHGRSAVDQVTLWHRKSRIAFQLKRKPELCLLISQQHTTLYGTAASPASCCDCWLIDTGSIWSWIWLAITALHLPPEMAKGAGYDASRTASHKDLS